MIRLILTDLDHTLLRSDGTISEHTLDVIGRCRDKGIAFAIATARYWIGAEKYIDILRPDYEITTDGTLIHSKEGCIYSSEFSVEDTNRIIAELLGALPTAEITMASGKDVYWNSKHIDKSEKLHKAIYCEYDRPLNIRGNKIVAELPDEKIARSIAEKVGCKLQCYRGENWYAFLPSGSGKTVAVEALAGSLGIDLCDIAAFGDDLNDIDMMNMCGTGVAVANAVKEVLDIADDVTLTNDEDGVARWLESHVLRS